MNRMSWSIPSKEEAEEFTQSFLAAQEAYYDDMNKIGDEPCHEPKVDFSELNPMRPEIESEIGMPLDGMGSWWYRCPMCHDPLDYRQKECSWCHLKIDWKGR